MAEETTDLVVVRGPENRALALPRHPVLVAAGADVVERAMEFFAVTIRNENTRAAYLRALRPFLDYVAALELGLGNAGYSSSSRRLWGQDVNHPRQRGGCVFSR